MKKIFAGVSLMLLLFFCAFLPAGAQPLHSHASLKGHVIDGTTQEHLPYINVGLKGTTLGVATDATGHYVLNKIPAGRYTVVASAVGYRSCEQEVELLAGSAVTVELTIHPVAMSLNEVVITGSRNETDKRSSAAVVNVLALPLFESAAAACPAEVLSFQPGLRMEQTCSNCGVPQLRINGLDGQYSQILLDSRPLFSSLAGVYGLEQYPVAMIERIEVIRGGGSALFGSSAIGGVVNIITKEPLRNTFSLSSNGALTEDGKSDVNLSLNGAFVSDDNRAGLYLFGMVRNRNAYDRNGDGFSDLPQTESETVGFRGYYKLGSMSKLTAEYHHIREFRRGGNHLDLPPHEADIAEQLRHSINGGGVTADLFFNDYRQKLSIYSSFQQIDRESYFGTGKDMNAYGSTTDFTYVGGTQLSGNADRFLFMPSQWVVGAECTVNALDDRMTGYNRTVDQDTRCYGLFAQNEWKNDRMSFLIGGRFDKHNLVKKPIFSPRVNVRYATSEKLSFRAGYSAGYRAPQAYDEDLHVAAVGGEVSLIELSPDLRPEYSHSVSVSADAYFTMGAVEANLLAELFHTMIDDVFTLEERGFDEAGNLILERRNGAGASVQGVNVELKFGMASLWSFYAGYTLQRSRYEEPFRWSQSTAQEAVRDMFRAPDQYGYCTLNLYPVKKLSLALTANYTSRMYVPHYGGQNIENDWVKHTPSFIEAGFRAAYDFSLSKGSLLQLSGGMKNIFDQYQRDIDKGENKDAGYVYGPSVPRTFYIGLKYSM